MKSVSEHKLDQHSERKLDDHLHSHSQMTTSNVFGDNRHSRKQGKSMFILR